MVNNLDPKRRIWYSAAKLWAANGYHGVGVAELSDAVELKKGSLYYHIGSKERLLFEILMNSMQRLLEASQISLMRASPKSRLHSLSRTLMTDISSHRVEWVVFFSDFKVLSGERARDILALRDEYEGLWEKVLLEGIEVGQFREIDRLAVKGVLGMHNYAFSWLSPEGRLDPHDVSDLFTNILVHGLEA